MKNTILRLFTASAVGCLAMAPLFAQKTDKQLSAADKYLISAEAGGVNLVEGEVSIARKDRTGGPLVKGDAVKTGERVSTGETGRAEILLNPGSYIRLGSNSTFQFRSTSLDDLRLKIEKGSAILEVLATNEFRVSVFAPKSRVTIVTTGVYRVDVQPDGNGTLSVIEGKAMAGERTPVLIKEGRQANLDGNAIVATRFDRNNKDELAIWSKLRSKDLSTIAKNIDRKGVRNTLLGMSSFSRGMGVWIFRPGLGWCFMPFWDGWDSPYGYGYRSIWGWWDPYYNPYYDGRNGGGGGSTGPSRTGDYKSGGVTSVTGPTNNGGNTKSLPTHNDLPPIRIEPSRGSDAPLPTRLDTKGRPIDQ